MTSYSFRDDYGDGAHPDILKALARDSTSTQMPYGEDEYSKNARSLIREKMNAPDAAVYFVTGGTLANLVCIGSCLRPHEAVIAASSGHIVTHETGAIEAVGHKIISVDPVKGKLTPEGISKALAKNSLFPHMAKPRLVYISNATEVGTIYSKAELTTIADLCKSNGLFLFMDGARLGVALAAQKNDLALEDIGHLTDMFWIGGTKLGLLVGEAIVINNPALKEDFRFHLKQRGALLAKGRALGVQFQEMFSNDLFFRLASHANGMAKQLSNKIRDAGFSLAEATATNQVFAIFPDQLVNRLQEQFAFYVWDKTEGKTVVRLVTSWFTSEEQIRAFIEVLWTNQFRFNRAGKLEINQDPKSAG